MKAAPKIWDATALSSTNTVKSAVTTCPSGRPPAEYLGTFAFTSTAVGTLKLEINNMGEQEYRQAVATAGTEAANTSGWQQQDLTPTPTIAVTAASSWDVTVIGRMVRFRFSYTNSSGSGAVTGRLAMPG